ncbi:MAG: hypothetical protein V9E82_09290 [Candidatus Nanopelagicales bacterium]
MAKVQTSARRRRSLRLRASGRWQAQVRVDGTYHPAPHTFDTKQAAQMWLNTQNKAIAAGTWSPPHRTLRPRRPGGHPGSATTPKRGWSSVA